MHSFLDELYEVIFSLLNIVAIAYLEYDSGRCPMSNQVQIVIKVLSSVDLAIEPTFGYVSQSPLDRTAADGGTCASHGAGFRETLLPVFYHP